MLALLDKLTFFIFPFEKLYMNELLRGNSCSCELVGFALSRGRSSRNCDTLWSKRCKDYFNFFDFVTPRLCRRILHENLSAVPETAEADDRSSLPARSWNMAHFIGVDVGTGSARAALFNSDGKIIKSAIQKIETFNPAANFYEQSSENIWSCVVHVVKVGYRINQNHSIESIKKSGFHMNSVDSLRHWNFFILRSFFAFN